MSAASVNWYGGEVGVGGGDKLEGPILQLRLFPGPNAAAKVVPRLAGCGMLCWTPNLVFLRGSLPHFLVPSILVRSPQQADEFNETIDLLID